MNTCDCLHCSINRTMDQFNERVHLQTHKPVNVDDNVAVLIDCAAELLAMYSDAQVRKALAKKFAQRLISKTRECRETGQYPGSPRQNALRLHGAN